ncbi:DUF6660 family protein [Spirosoma sp. KUDC1026]|uniref:DUF6660 family protein n=1 Tax=Spirosoma sp. KUDC1026 TaxID=2745947 RepID=UPI00159BC941|nr:DUF6660 family protein [Spirosoma sp. KUDC1026]QKZ14908.1 hypothetical protein HU175_20670 [Spirosoma sp. KUDC1026]
MKWWMFLLAMYVLVLSGLPCEAFCPEEPITNQASLPDTDQHEHDERCSPFCLCAACSGFTIPQARQFLEAPLSDTLITVAIMSSYQTPHTLDVPERIWQPPRLD